MTSERDMLNLLTERYTNIRVGSLADRWVRAEHVKRFLSNAPFQRIADFVCADKWPGASYGSNLALYGHEVKVSRSDWLSELRKPDKAEAIKKYMHYWYLVVPDASIVKQGELPEGWGLMTIAGEKLRAKIKAPLLTPEPMPLDFTINLMSAAARTAAREVQHRDAPPAYVKSWDAKCSVCGTMGPCPYHQPRWFDLSIDSTTEGTVK